MRHLNWLVELEQSEIGHWPAKEIPARFSESPVYQGDKLDRHGPSYGEDKDYVLCAVLGLDEKTIAELDTDVVSFPANCIFRGA